LAEVFLPYHWLLPGYDADMDSAIRARIEALARNHRAHSTPPGKASKWSLTENVRSGLYQADDVEEGNTVRLILVQVIVVAYREARKNDPEVASWLFRSYLEDHPEAPGSRLFEKCDGLLEAAHTLKAVAGTRDSRVLFQATKEVHRAVGEFVPLLMAWLALLWQVKQGEQPEFKLLKAQTPAGTKVKRFTEITNGEDGIFYLLSRLINVQLRNAIAHSTVTLDEENARVSFSRIENGVRVYEHIDLTKYMADIYMHTRLPAIYLAALSGILVMETGTPEERLSLPAVIIQAFSGVKLTGP